MSLFRSCEFSLTVQPFVLVTGDVYLYKEYEQGNFLKFKVSNTKAPHSCLSISYSSQTTLTLVFQS